MKRRSFLAPWSRIRDKHTVDIPSSARVVASGLEPYVPGPGSPWDALRAGHLLRRAVFLPKWSEMATLMPMTPSAAVDLLMSTPSTPAPPSVADSITESLAGLDTRLQGEVTGQWNADAVVLRQWNADVMRGGTLSIVEKMTAFWSNHFAVEFKVDNDYVIAPLLYRQNKLFREAGLGSFRELMRAITLDAGMLVYLGGALNTVGKPNENYAREMLELYTTGLGHYTEGDIKEAARILTGWRVSQFSDEPSPNGFFNSYFSPADHDIGAKQFLGVSFPARDTSTNTEFLVRRDEVWKMIDTIFEKRPRAIAEFISRKLYRFFVYSNPAAGDAATISAMADVMIAYDFTIAPVVATLLKSAHFYDNANIGAQIKTPAEFEIGLARQLGNKRQLAVDMTKMGQELFNPPNVGGWPGHHDWITTTTYPVRAEVAQDVVANATESELIAFITQFPDHDEIDPLVEKIAALLLPRPLSNSRKQTLREKLLGPVPDYEWGQIVATSPSTAARNLREMLAMIVQLPDFQLC